jgi:hypothetical protein
MPAKLNFFKTPASVRLVSSPSVSTYTGISGCFQPGQAKVVPGPTPMGKLHSLLRGQEGPGGGQHGIPGDGQEGPEKVHQEEGLEDMVIRRDNLR